MSVRARLTPQMLDYEAKFSDGGQLRWLPYLMYFHPAGHRSKTVNTDAVGFRYSDVGGRAVSVADHDGIGPACLLAGSSTAFGIGASSDAWTLPSRLSVHDSRPWLNFGGRSFNSTQEAMLLTLHRHLLPEVEEIVLLSGFNDLGLARLPESERGDHGAFFNCQRFFDAFGSERGPIWQRMRRAKAPSMDEQIAYAADLTLRHLDIWRIVADDLGARLSYVLQPLAGWVRDTGSPEEEALFAELDELGSFGDTYGDILQPSVNVDYAARLEAGAKGMGVGFVNLSPVLASALSPREWLFVDRIHFTDHGHDLVARQLLERISS